jgi:hypothetical protein
VSSYSPDLRSEVRDRVQTWHPLLDCWVKLDTRIGRILAVKKSPGGTVSLTCFEQKRARRRIAPSLGLHRIPPLLGRLGAEDPQRRARDEMALKVEGVVNGGVHAEKPLGIEPV